MKKKGQALVEFIIILPIFIMLVIGVFDIGNILISKIHLESTLSQAVELYKKNYSLEEIKKDLEIDSNRYELYVKKDEKYQTLTIVKKVDIITPGLNIIFDNPYEVSISRSTYNE